jgi:zinc/manganese transport system permease protein
VSVGFSWNIISDFRYMWEFDFARNAFEAGTIIAIVAGIIGYFVVLRRSAFATHALGHVGFSGAAGAVLFGVNPVYGLLLFTMSGATGMALLGQKASTRDVEIGTVLAFMLAVGLLFLTLYNGFATEAYSILFGEVLGISDAGVVFTLEASAVVLVVLLLVYRRLLFASLDEDVAEAKGLPMVALGLVFMLLLAVAISIAVQVIGVLLIFALMVTPAAIAVRLTTRPFTAVVLSILVAVFAVWVGLFVAFFSPYPPSFFIVSTAFVLYLAVRIALVVSADPSGAYIPVLIGGALTAMSGLLAIAFGFLWEPSLALTQAFGWSLPIGELGAIALALGLFVILGAGLMKLYPQNSKVWAVLVIGASLASCLAGGGFYVGAVLGVAGGVLALTRLRPNLVSAAARSTA